MPLSEHEQRILDEIAKQLAEDDPSFAESVRTTTPRRHASGRFKLAIAGFVLGLGILLVGLVAGLENSALTVAFGSMGFVVMLLSFTIGARASKSLGAAVANEVKERRRSSPPKKGFKERLDERWQKRMDGDDPRR